MLRGKSYTVNTGRLAANGRRWTLKFDEAKSRSEAVHVNLIGYRPMATQKFAYVYQWMGDQGSLDLRPHSGRPFHLIDEATGRTVFTGKLMFRAPVDPARDVPQDRLAPRRQLLEGRRLRL